MITNIFQKDNAAILHELRNCINEYYQNGNKLNDDEIGELRSEISSLLFFMADITFREISADRVPIKSRLEKAEGDYYIKHYKIALKDQIIIRTPTVRKLTVKEMKELETTETEIVSYREVISYMSQSQADSYARKAYKADPEYIKIIEDCETIEQDYWTLDRIFKQANEVLNSMGKRNK